MRGIGVDVINISRMAEIIERSGDLFITRVFTKAEQKAGMEHYNRVIYYATAFAAKEAVFKMFGIDWESRVDFHEIEVFRGSHGEPIVELNGRIAEISQKDSGGKVLVSLSYDGDFAIAIAALM